jgi:hypothetical protein
VPYAVADLPAVRYGVADSSARFIHRSPVQSRRSHARRA